LIPLLNRSAYERVLRDCVSSFRGSNELWQSNQPLKALIFGDLVAVLRACERFSRHPGPIAIRTG
jgi:hypothetical protein